MSGPVRAPTIPRRPENHSLRYSGLTDGGESGRFSVSQHSCLGADESFSLGIAGATDGIPTSLGRDQSPSGHSPGVLSTSCPSTGASRIGQRSGNTSQQGCHQSRAELQNPRVLLPTVHSSKTHRRVQTSSGPLPVEQILASH